MRRLISAVAMVLLSCTGAVASQLQVIYPADSMYQGWRYYKDEYGNDRSFMYDRNHLGADIDLPEGTPIRAVMSGRLLVWRAQSDPNDGYGELVAVIETELPTPTVFTNALGQSVSTKYVLWISGHMRKSQERNGTPLSWYDPELTRKPPQFVNRGNIIGYINNSSHPDRGSPDPNGDGFEHWHGGLRLSSAATAKAADPNFWFRGYLLGSGFAKDFADPIAVIQGNLLTSGGTLMVIDNPGPHPTLVVNDSPQNYPPITVTDTPVVREVLRLVGADGTVYLMESGYLQAYRSVGGASTLGVPLGSKIGSTWRFDRGYLRSDGTIVRAYRYDGTLIEPSRFVVASAGDGTNSSTPPPPSIIPITGVALVIMPTEPGYRYQLGRGQESMTFNLQVNHAGDNPPLTYRFYIGAALISQGADAFCSITLSPGTHAIRARVEAGTGNTLQSQEVSQQILVEAAPKSDWNVPFDVAVASIARDGERLYAAGRYQNGKGYLYQARRDAPGNGQSYTFGFSFNEILPMREYVFAATSSGLMVSREQGASWSTVYSNGQAYDIAILPGDKWNDWPLKILVGCSRGVDYGNWFPSEPNTLRDIRIIGSFGPYTIEGGRYRTREELFIIASGNGISSRRAPWHLAYVENAGSLAGSGGGRAYTMRSEDNVVLAAVQRNAGDNVYYSNSYGDGWSWEKVRGIPAGNDVVAFGWISGVGWGAITTTGALYCAPSDPTRWRPVAGFKEMLGLDLAAGQTVTCMKEVGPDMLIGTSHGLRVVPMERITRLASKPVDTDEQPALAPEPALLENYPNPFNSETTIRFQLPEARHVTLRVYAITGSLVAELVHETLPAGTHTVIWGGSRHGNGVYVCVLQAGNHRNIRKLALLK